MITWYHIFFIMLTITVLKEQPKVRHVEIKAYVHDDL